MGTEAGSHESLLLSETSATHHWCHGEAGCAERLRRFYGGGGLVAKSCPTLATVAWVCRLPHGLAISFSRGSSQPRDWTQVFCITVRFFTDWATREAQCSPTWHQNQRFYLFIDSALANMSEHKYIISERFKRWLFESYLHLSIKCTCTDTISSQWQAHSHEAQLEDDDQAAQTLCTDPKRNFIWRSL